MVSAKNPKQDFTQKNKTRKKNNYNSLKHVFYIDVTSSKN